MAAAAPALGSATAVHVLDIGSEIGYYYYSYSAAGGEAVVQVGPGPSSPHEGGKEQGSAGEAGRRMVPSVFVGKKSSGFDFEEAVRTLDVESLLSYL